MKVVKFLGFALVGAASVAAGCGADSSTSLFGSSSNSNVTGSGGAGATGGSSTTSSSGDTTSSGTATGSGGAGGMMGTGGMGSSSSASSTSASSTAASSTASSSSTGGGPTTTVFCGGNECNAGEVCCFHLQDANLDTCGAPGSCDPNQGFITLSCNEPADCPGQICCATRTNQTYQDVSCQDTCTGTGKIVLCDPNNPVCPQQGQTCQASQTLPDGYFICRF